MGRRRFCAGHLKMWRLSLFFLLCLQDHSIAMWPWPGRSRSPLFWSVCVCVFSNSQITVHSFIQQTSLSTSLICSLTLAIGNQPELEVILAGRAHHPMNTYLIHIWGEFLLYSEMSPDPFPPRPTLGQGSTPWLALPALRESLLYVRLWTQSSRGCDRWHQEAGGFVVSDWGRC